LTPPGAPSPESPRRSWADLGPRLGSAFVLIPLTALTLYVGGYVFGATVGLVFALAYREWETMIARRRLSITGMVLTALVVLAGIVFPLWSFAGTAGVIAVAVVIAVLFGGEGRLWRAGGLVFFGIVIASVLALRGTGTDGIAAGVVLGATIWITDSAAFFTGRQIGGEKLAPDISPSKTWSGALGGLALGTAAGFSVWIAVGGAPWYIGLALCLITSVLGQLGDLAESAIKRRFRIKDSGDIIPGHGGFMDRMDSLTFGAIFVFLVGLIHSGYGDVAAGYLHW
jgi:phosphatidate cytidylyltransferase